MGKEIVYCEVCGDRILELEFEKGRAITLLNKNYCVNCKEDAIRTIGIDESMLEEPAPPPPPKSSSSTARLKAVRTPVPTSRTPAPSTRTPVPQTKTPIPSLVHSPPAGIRTPSRAPSGSGLRPAVQRPSNTPLIVGVVAGAALLCLVLLLIMAGGGNGGTSPAASAPPSTKPEATKPPQPPQPDKAGLAMARIRGLVDAGVDPQKILDECAAAASAVAGTVHERTLKAIEKDARDRLAFRDKSRELDKLLADLEALPAKDEKFLRIDEALQWVDRMLVLVRDLPARDPHVAEARKNYLAKYNGAAYEFYETVHREATAFANEGRFDTAVKVIERRFPPQFRKSTYWPSLESDMRRYRMNAGGGSRDPDPAPVTPSPAPGPDTTPEPTPSPPPAGVEDPFPAFESPEIGKWVTVFDGKSMELFHPMWQPGENKDNWQLRDGILVGQSSRPAPEGRMPTTAEDLLILKYRDVQDCEVEYKIKIEGTGAVLGGRLGADRDGKAIGVMVGIFPTDWVTILMKIEGGKVTFTRNGSRMLDRVEGLDKMLDRGRVFWGILPGAKVQLKDVKFLRTK